MPGGQATTTAATTTTRTTTTAAQGTTAGPSGATRTTHPSGALVVRKSPGSGEFGSLAAALSSLGTSATTARTIFIYPGTYEGRVEILYRGPLTIQGYTTKYVKLQRVGLGISKADIQV